MNAIKLSYCGKFVVKQLEEKEESLKKKKRVINRKGKMLKKKGNVKEEEIENEFVDEILKKKRESGSAKKLERINQLSCTQKKLSCTQKKLSL